jgi:type II secretory pathway component PulK
MRCKRVVLVLVLLAVMSLLVSACQDRWAQAGQKLRRAKERLETWSKKQEQRARRLADKVSRDIEDFFAGQADR